MVSIGEQVVARAKRDPKYKTKVIAKLEENAKDLKARLVKVERALRAFRKI
jgi:hypothetical protein